MGITLDLSKPVCLEGVLSHHMLYSKSFCWKSSVEIVKRET